MQPMLCKETISRIKTIGTSTIFFYASNLDCFMFTKPFYFLTCYTKLIVYFYKKELAKE